MVRRAKGNAFGMDKENLRGELGRHIVCVEGERSERPRKIRKGASEASEKARRRDMWKAVTLCA